MLMKAKRQEWKDARQKRSPKPPTQHALTVQGLRNRQAPDDSTSLATIKNKLQVNTLWVSGAAREVITTGTLKALQDQGVSITVKTLGEALTLLDFQKRPLTFDST